MEHTDKRLERIRRYEGSIKDLIDFIDDKAKETAAETIKSKQSIKSNDKTL